MDELSALQSAGISASVIAAVLVLIYFGRHIRRSQCISKFGKDTIKLDITDDSNSSPLLLANKTNRKSSALPLINS